jgi:predicted dehydrogenase
MPAQRGFIVQLPASHSAARERTSLPRRRLLAGGAAALIPAIVTRRSPGAASPNDTIRVAAIGIGRNERGRGRLLVEQLPPDGRIVAICDCNLPAAERFKAESKAADKETWDVVSDYRRILDRRDIDAVIVATGEFQRVLPCIAACQAGKDVYAEKPLSWSIGEGRALVDAVKRQGRILQVGTQQRSMAINRLACEFVRSGGLGKLLEVRAINYAGPLDPPPGGFPAQDVPRGFDWDTWLNQAPLRDYNPEWLNWMRWRDFSGGDMTNWGAHGVDQIQCALGTDDTGPVAIRLLGAGPNAPLAMRYASGLEVKFILEKGKGPHGGGLFVGERGKLEINRNKIASNPPEIAAGILAGLDAAEEDRKWSDDAALWQARWHLQNWLDCIRDRNPPVSTAEAGHRSISVCHLANIARRLGRELTWDPAAEHFTDDEANSLVAPPRRRGFELPA